MIFRVFEWFRVGYDRLTFAVKAGIGLLIAAAVYRNYQRIYSGRADELSVSGEPSNRVEAMAVAISDMIA